MIVWDESNEYVTFDGNTEEPPQWAWSGEFTAAVIMNGWDKLEEPIWLHPNTAHDLVEADILTYDATHKDRPVAWQGFFVYLLGGPL